MELWEQLLAGAIALVVIFIFFPGVKTLLIKSKHAKEKHWDSIITLTIILIVFVYFLISTVRH